MKKTKEKYVQSPIYPDRYKVSDSGNVMSVRSKKILKPRKTKGGYLQVCLMKENEGKWVYVHRLVAEAFIPNVVQNPEIDHINGDRTDNNLSNLLWVTSKENKNNPVTRLRMKAGKAAVRKPVSQYTKEGEWITNYESITTAAEKTGINKACVGMCCRGSIKTTGGYIFKYKQTEKL